jgi:hypothetical protein
MATLWTIALAFGAALVAAIGGLAAWYAWMVRSRRRPEPGYDYVMVLEDGEAREVTLDEREYLETEFSPADGARPYIKFRYESVDGWGSLAGFLLRRQLPARIGIRSADTEDSQHPAAKTTNQEAEQGAAGQPATTPRVGD